MGEAVLGIGLALIAYYIITTGLLIIFALSLAVIVYAVKIIMWVLKILKTGVDRPRRTL